MNGLVEVERTQEVSKPTPATLPVATVARMKELAAASVSDATKTAYASDWSIWCGWCDRRGAVSMPAHPVDVAGFVAEQSGSKKLTTLRRYLATISAMHRRKGYDFDRHHSSIRAVLDGLRRTIGNKMRQVAALRPEHVEQMFVVELQVQRDKIRWLRDRAIIMLGLSGGRRRSELAGLDWLEIGSGMGVALVKSEGILLDLRATKTGEKQVPIQHEETVAAVMAWVEAADIQPGSPLFRGIDRAGTVADKRLSGMGVARAVKSRAKSIGLDAADFGGHSLRAGLVTSALAAGVERHVVKKQSGHRSDAMLETYDREANLWTHKVDVKAWEGRGELEA